jgi:uncharacterized protein YbaA (DUF1428 family)
MAYVDGFVIPVPKKNVKAYLKMARWGLRMWKKTARWTTRNACSTT